MQAGLKKAIKVPFDLMTLCQECWTHLSVLAEHGNIQTMSDLQVSFITNCSTVDNLKIIIIIIVTM